MLTVVEMPSLSPTMQRGKIVKWCKQEGDYVEKAEILLEVESDKANVEVESQVSGFLRKILIQEGVEVPVNTPVGVIADRSDEDISRILETIGVEPIATQKERESVVAEPESAPVAEPPEERKPIRISPLARRMIQEEGIAIETLEGTGPGGRIVKEDVERAVAERAGKVAAQRSAVAESAQLGSKDYEDIPLTKMRKVTARRLQESKQSAPHFYIDMTADATAITNHRAELATKLEKLDEKITFNDILIKLAAQALREFPMLNATFLGDRIRIHRAINIGVAVGVEEGLIVPVVQNADQKTILQISREVQSLAEKARSKRLLPEEYSGGTFTITNLGMFGVETSHAIINPPECAILAAGAILSKPVFLAGEISVRPCLQLSLSVDHRVVDGVLAAQFLGRIRELVETPFLMLL